MNTVHHGASPCTSINPHSQRLIDHICYKRIHSPDFAQKPTRLQRILRCAFFIRSRRLGGVA